MKNTRKGFTLIELVIVIAVIAILAGVIIGTFATVVKRANESAKLQEMKAAEIEQKANDILEKIDNADWFGWEDLETKIGESIQNAIASSLPNTSSIDISDLDQQKTAIINAVDQAIAKYAASQGTQNTGLTAEEVQYIVEQAVTNSGAVTQAQVKAIVTAAVSGVSTLQPTQIQKIVEAAANKVVASQLTAADLAQALKGLVTEEAMLTAISNATAGMSKLTSKEVAQIVSKYVLASGEAKGDYSWYDPTKTSMDVPATEEALIAMSILSQTGETFEGKTLKLVGDTENKEIQLEEKWIPIRVFKGTLDGSGYEIKNIDVSVVYWATEGSGSTGTDYYLGKGAYSEDWFGERKAYGFIGLLGGTVKNLTLNYNTSFEDPKAVYIVFGGVAGNVVFDSEVEISDVTIKGTINGYQCIGGLLGSIHSGNVYATQLEGMADETLIKTVVLLKDNKVEVSVTTSYTSVSPANGGGHGVAGSILGEINMYANRTKLTVTGNEVTGQFTANGTAVTYAVKVNSSAWEKNYFANDWVQEADMTLSHLEANTLRLLRNKK